MGHFAAAIEQTLTQWRDARRCVLRGQAGQSSVHAWRVASRRLFAMEQLLAPHLPSRRSATLHQMLHDAFHASGELRDAQLAMQRLESLAADLPAAARLARHLRRRLPKLRRATTQRIRRVRPREVRRMVRAWHSGSAPDFERAVRVRAARRLLAATRMPPMALERGATAASIHGQRIRLKGLRYMSELQRAAGGAVPRTSRKRFAARQVQLGAITDLQSLLQSIERYGARHRKWNAQAAALRAHLQLQRQQLLGRLNAPAPAAARRKSATRKP